MHFIRNIILFFTNNVRYLKRKWLSLPLLLLLPIIIIGLVITITISFFSPSETTPIQVGLVDMEQSKETQLVVDLIEESSQLGSFIQLKGMKEQTAEASLQSNDLTAYIVFPSNFTTDLYKGNSVTIPIIGNPQKPIESHMVKQLIESITRHIRASQANILTINQYAKNMNIADTTRNDLVFEQFKEFLFYTIGKDKIISEEKISNQTTSAPLHYYGLGSWFIIFTLWMLGMYSLLGKEEPPLLKTRMSLYGVSEMQQLIAKIMVTGLFSTFLAGILFFILNYLLNWSIPTENVVRITLICFLYGIIFLVLMAFVEIIISSAKLRLLIQAGLTGFMLLISGALIPTIYFPLILQDILQYSPSTEAFYWLQQIVLEQRLFADYLPLFLLMSAVILTLIGVAQIKERTYL
ncbi:ABC transporter permease [Virgibacillus halodenitrificans]|jgi:ABC-2 type transport system permease protein|uniref:ABC transporter ATP-binding protein n=1 Tax=Virgibacillus halodenitrificans TaxID=1482 RepID=A0AAC9IZM4_VIRHA|nr:ABC transporter permease [Virgibacillus halodenitrificans]APC48075.1 ABC transporter ATP-binding protein [Virgibacillus halodenitrificans]MBD1223708.1 ABC transporter permease [Virgibacillus halodenitrificans]MCG1027847.1 ABC transporter permease [Virgibacillus halodenitrificans]MYL55968.1 ABC transporter permease [Virgibacillus halodenitrificans]